ncbi:MAG: hypothetical protein LBW85_07200, partial [Deltaproteobacteria bacterium]|nr:hypothetical protein [Deltaproteobacteria bacterium]
MRVPLLIAKLLTHLLLLAAAAALGLLGASVLSLAGTISRAGERAAAAAKGPEESILRFLGRLRLFLAGSLAAAARAVARTLTAFLAFREILVNGSLGPKVLGRLASGGAAPREAQESGVQGEAAGVLAEAYRRRLIERPELPELPESSFRVPGARRVFRALPDGTLTDRHRPEDFFGKSYPGFFPVALRRIDLSDRPETMGAESARPEAPCAPRPEEPAAQVQAAEATCAHPPEAPAAQVHAAAGARAVRPEPPAAEGAGAEAPCALRPEGPAAQVQAAEASSDLQPEEP